ncbi:golgin subfamily A member 6-like protein 7 isoform X2 [Pungitius pungitius]|uniref:golgin subfamily A member 6-like protein 7 isoform X2 n=1 Tax=Pungitius pungitius TaxID=134920 RepID=UPI002E133053
MADRGHDGGADVTDELLHTDINNSRKDPCDLLLDAIDAQLGQLQVHPTKCRTISREMGGNDADPLLLSQSLSKDTGFGSTTRTNDTPLSCLDLIHTPKMDQTSDNSTPFQEDPVTHGENKLKLDRRIRDKEENVTEGEQVMWRLRRLLGDTCNEGSMTGESNPPSDSICTEDFVGRFRDEMVESELAASNTKQLDKEEWTERQVGFGDWISEQKGRSILNVRTSSSYGVNTSRSETTAAEERCKPQRPRCDGTRDPVWSFDTTSIESDLDSINIEQVEQLGHRSSNENVQNGSPKAQLKRRQTYRLVCSSGDGDKDTDVEVNHWRRQSSTERTPEKMESDGAKMKERLSTLRQKCEKEEMTLQKKKAQIKEVDLFLSELKQRRKELKQLTVETAKMEKQKRTLEFVLRDNRARESSISCQRKESFILQRVEETREELQLVTEANSSLRNTCASLEEKLEAVKCQLGECKIRVATQDKMLAQKELQVFDLHVERGALQAERDGLRGELRHMKVLQCRALKEAHEKARGAMEAALKQQKKELTLAHEHQIQKVNKQTEEEKANMLKEEALFFTHIEALKSSVQLKEEETKMLRGSLEQQEDREEQLNALEKESHRALLRLGQTVQVAEKEADKLRRMREDSEGSPNQATAELEQQLRHWAQELGAECRHLHLLLEPSGAQHSAVEIAHSPTAAEALTHLRTLREQLKRVINHLHQELDSQKETSEQLRKEMERQLSVQRQQLRMDKDRALDALKERLIQEHIEELSSLWAHPCEGRAEARAMAASLRRQLKAKDLQLRQLQRSMAQWKERTAAGMQV